MQMQRSLTTPGFEETLYALKGPTHQILDYILGSEKLS
jgi:hypothetical protein